MLHHVSLLYTHLAKYSEHDQMLFAKNDHREHIPTGIMSAGLFKKNRPQIHGYFLMD